MISVATGAQTTAKEWFDKGAAETDMELKIAYYSKSIRLDPNYGNAYSNRGLAYHDLGRETEAIADIDKAIELKAPDPHIDYNNRGSAKKALGRTDDAIRDYDKAIQLKPDYADAYYNRGIAKRALMRYEDAINDYTLSIKYDPINPEAFNNRGNAKDDLGRYEEALLDYNKAIQFKPNYSLAYNNRGVANEHLGRLREAEADYKKAIALDPTYETARSNLKDIQAKLLTAPLPAPRIWAVAVGIGRYQYETELTPLKFPTKQAYEFVRYVERKDFIDNEVPVLVDADARRSAILNTLERTFVRNSAIGPEDMVIFYYTGHGMTFGTRIGICPYDYYNQAELITDEEILDILNRCPARHKICVVEACKTQVVTMGAIRPEVKQKFNEQRKNVKGGIVYITSTRAGEESYEYPDIGGVFSYYFLKGIKGDADSDNDGTVMANELFQYLKSNVSARTNGKQEPQINIEGNRAIPVIVID